LTQRLSIVATSLYHLFSSVYPLASVANCSRPLHQLLITAAPSRPPRLLEIKGGRGALGPAKDHSHCAASCGHAQCGAVAPMVHDRGGFVAQREVSAPGGGQTDLVSPGGWRKTGRASPGSENSAGFSGASETLGVDAEPVTPREGPRVGRGTPRTPGHTTGALGVRAFLSWWGYVRSTCNFSLQGLMHAFRRAFLALKVLAVSPYPARIAQTV
jgi:hypothetical protein